MRISDWSSDVCSSDLLRTPDRGEIKLGGRSLAVFDRRERARMIGLLSQRADIHWDVDVATLVGLGRLPHRGRWSMNAADQAAIAAAMVAPDCTHPAPPNVQRPSGGEQGRRLLARVTAGGPQS